MSHLLSTAFLGGCRCLMVTVLIALEFLLVNCAIEMYVLYFHGCFWNINNTNI